MNKCITFGDKYRPDLEYKINDFLSKHQVEILSVNVSTDEYGINAIIIYKE